MCKNLRAVTFLIVKIISNKLTSFTFFINNFTKQTHQIMTQLIIKMLQIMLTLILAVVNYIF